TPSRQALWSTTSKGDIMLHEPSLSLEALAHAVPCDLMFWRQIPGHLRCVESNSLGLVWGIGWDGTAWVYSGSFGQQPSPGNLWYRQGLTPSYPQGSAWELISNNVTKVSVGPLDQVGVTTASRRQEVWAEENRVEIVWIVADGVPGFPTETPGAICHRLSVGPMQPKGLSWDYGIGVS
ncbi:hypothetical protein XENOCAPTIV_020347, partial [Xenoophorus captivus]